MVNPPKRPRGRPRIEGPRKTGPDVAQISLRLPRDLHAEVAALAAAEHRSLNEQIVVLLTRVLGPSASTPAKAPAKKRPRAK